MYSDHTVFTDKNLLVSSLLKDIRNSNIGCAGFKSKQNLHNYLVDAIFGYEDKNIKKIPKYDFDTHKIISIIKDTIKLCHEAIPSVATHIFVFPTFSTFVKEKMYGVTGYAPYKNTILIFINPQNLKWRGALRTTVAHEFNHSVILKYNKWETLLDSLIFEGLAENFKEYVIDSKQSSWVATLGLNQSKELFLNLKNHLRSKSYKLYRSVFLENKKYPLWAGYAIGYQIVCSFIKANQNIKWQQIVKLHPKDILERSNFIKKAPK